MSDTVKEYTQKASEFLTEHAPFITSRYRNNRQAYKEIGVVLALLFLLLSLFILPSETETVSVSVDHASKLSTTTTTTNSHGILDVFALYLQIVGGTAVLGAAYFGWKRLEVNQEGQITERFTRAIDQLGSKSLEVRLGGVFALERIAKDSEKDYWPIMEVLTAYVREKSPWQSTEQPEALKKVPPDIQATLKVLGRTGESSYEMNVEGMKTRARLNLSNAYLYGVDLTAKYLESIIFDKSFLMDGVLACGQFQHASFEYANLENANFMASNLEGAFFVGANLSNVNLVGSYAKGVVFEDAIMVGTILDNANLTEAVALTKEQIESAFINSETQLPDYLMEDPGWYEEQIKRSEEWLAEKVHE